MLRDSTVLVLAGCLGLVSVDCRPSQGTPAMGSGGSSPSGSTGGIGGMTGSGGQSSDSGGGVSGGTADNGDNSGTAGSGGSSGSGGTGFVASGGTTVASGGAGGQDRSGGTGGGAGGGAGSGGSAGAGGASGGGSGTSANCITQSSQLSAKIATVGIVTWSTTVSDLSSAHIDFGLDTSYGMTAPVTNPSASNNTTLLLGMKQKQTYHYRIVVSGSSANCTSDDATITTGSLANGLPTITVTNSGDKSKLFSGFLVTGQYMAPFNATGAPAYILDGDGDIVWAYNIGQSQVTGAKMTYDGTHMWINTANVPEGSVHVHLVAMDGSTDEDLSSKFAGLNHQLTVEPDETVAFCAYNDSYQCEDIKEYSPSTGNVKTVVNSSVAEGMTKGSGTCHCNNVQYSSDDALVFSDLDNQVVVKVKRSDGSTVWILNGSKPTTTGVSWAGGQHGIDIISLNDLLIFNNNSTMVAGTMTTLGGTGKGSIALEVMIDSSGKTASKVWSYTANPGIQNDIMGDVQRLPNGNTVIAYSTEGVVQEVDSQGNLLLDWEFPLGSEFGYIEKRASLYGNPPR